MSFRRLDYFNLLSDDEIAKCFYNLFGVNDGRSISDMLNTLITYDFKLHYDLYDDKELLIMSMYFDIRKTLYVIDFKAIYPVFRNNIESYSYNSNKDIIKKIKNTLDLDFDVSDSESDCESEHDIFMSFCSSPTTKSSYIRCCSPSSESESDSISNLSIF